MRSELNTDLLQDLPIFPIPDVVLFPGAVIPLHIFEPRYREMTSDLLEGNGILALTQPLTHSPRTDAAPNGNGLPALPRVAGVGSIMACERLPDGCFNLLVRGMGRIEITEELPLERSYRRVRAKALCDLTTKRPKDFIAGHRQLVELCARFSNSIGERGSSLRDMVGACSEPATCVDLVLAAIVCDPSDRQRLLETLDPADRIETAIQHIAQLICEHGSCGEIPN